MSLDVRQRLRRAGWVQTILTLALLMLVNHLALQLQVRWDLTSEKRHTLSDVARETVAGLQRPLLARVFFSEGLQAPYHDHRGVLLDLLSELSAHARGRLEVVVVDPASEPDAASEAARLGVRPLLYAFRSWDRTEARTVYMGVAFLYGERRAAVDALVSVPAMEAEVIGAIRRVTAGPDATRRVGWMLGHGERDPAQAPAKSPVRELVRRMQQTSQVRTLAPGAEPIPEDLDALMVVAPREPFAPEEVAGLDRYLHGGGALFLWLSSVQPDFERNVPVRIAHGLGDWLAHHGVAVSSASLLDREHTEQMAVPVEIEGRGRQLVRLNYPLALTTTNLDRSVGPVRHLSRLLLPFASPVGLRDGEWPELERAVWAQTMPEAVAVPALATIDPRAVRQPITGEQAGPHPVAVALAGRFTRSEPGEGPALGRPTRMVVVGSGDALPNNLDFALNALDWLVGDPALIEIRSRDVGSAPLRVPPRATALRAKLLVALFPLAVLAALAAFGLRRRK